MLRFMLIINLLCLIKCYKSDSSDFGQGRHFAFPQYSTYQVCYEDVK